MNKSILSLILVGLVLGMVHTPDVLLALVIIAGLVTLSVKLFWGVMQAFSSTGRHKNAIRRTS